MGEPRRDGVLQRRASRAGGGAGGTLRLSSALGCPAHAQQVCSAARPPRRSLDCHFLAPHPTGEGCCSGSPRPLELPLSSIPRLSLYCSWLVDFIQIRRAARVAWLAEVSKEQLERACGAGGRRLLEGGVFWVTSGAVCPWEARRRLFAL